MADWYVNDNNAGIWLVEVLKAWERRHLEFYYLDFTRSDLREEIDILLSDGLLDRIGELDNEIRYRFPRRLQLVLGQCSELNDDLFSVMIRIFLYLRSPTLAEKKWLDFFYGHQTNGPVEQWLRDLRHNRRFIKRKNKYIISEIGESMRKIHKNFVNIMHSLSNEKYRYFIEKILEYIYPPFMRKSFSYSDGIEEYLRTQA